MIIWTVTSADQCTNTDACGSYSFNPLLFKVTPTLGAFIPYGRPRPIVTNLNGINNVINVQGSLFYANNTYFGIKVESYAVCNGVPRFKSACCITKSENGCLTTGDETAYQISATLPSTYKCKVTIRAVSIVNSGEGYGTSDLYEGIIDIDPTSASPPTNSYCNLIYKRMYNADPNGAKQICLFNQ